MRPGIIIGVLALALAPSAHAAQQLTVVNRIGVPRSELQTIERAIVWQSERLQIVWRTPVVRFGAGGWPIYLTRYGRAASGFRQGEAAYHDHDRTTGRPYMVIGSTRRHQVQSVSMSHEVMEALVDAEGDRYINYELVEVVDPVEQLATYGPGHVMLADFVKPAFYRPQSHVRWLDWLHEMSG